MTTSTLVIGRGLLGGAVVRIARGGAHAADAVAWDSPADAVDRLRELVGRHTQAPSWRIAWCAGAGTVGSDAGSLERETEYLEAVLAAVAPHTAVGSKFVLVSSAGGVHALGTPDWITEASPTHARAPYGFNKLRQEQLVREWADRTGADVLVARPTNLYGPGQRLAKPQGLVSQVLYRTLRREALPISVPEETQRDFIYVDDAAQRLCDWMAMPATGTVETKLICSGRSVTISQLLRLARAATGVEPRVVRRNSPASALQPRHLRYRSTVLTELDRVPRSLESGMAMTWADLLRQFSRGALRPPVTNPDGRLTSPREDPRTNAQERPRL